MVLKMVPQEILLEQFVSNSKFEICKIYNMDKGKRCTRMMAPSSIAIFLMICLAAASHATIISSFFSNWFYEHELTLHFFQKPRQNFLSLTFLTRPIFKLLLWTICSQIKLSLFTAFISLHTRTIHLMDFNTTKD